MKCTPRMRSDFSSTKNLTWPSGLNIQIRFGPGIDKEREPANFMLHSILLQVLFRLANPRNFRMGINHTRNLIIIHVAVSRAYMFRRRCT